MIYQALKKYSNWKVILSLLILTLLFMTVVFPHFEAKINKAANEKVRILDARFSYNLEQVNSLFDKMGSEGRGVYRFISANVDMVYPIVYGLFFILSIASFLKKIFPARPKTMLVALIPLIAVLFDYLENFNTLKMLGNFPNITPDEVAKGALFTQLKWEFIVISIFLILVLAAAAGIIKLLIRANVDAR